MAARKASGITSAEEKIIRVTAASKGFNCVDDYVFHILRQNPNWCGILYDKYARGNLSSFQMNLILLRRHISITKNGER